MVDNLFDIEHQRLEFKAMFKHCQELNEKPSKHEHRVQSLSHGEVVVLVLGNEQELDKKKHKSHMHSAQVLINVCSVIFAQ